MPITDNQLSVNASRPPLFTATIMDTPFFDRTPLELFLSTTSEQLTKSIATFKYENGISKLIAVCGGSLVAGLGQEKVLADVFAQLQPFAPHVAILTGGTRGGLPEAATKLAHQYGLQVLAVVPACAKPANLMREVACRIQVESLVVNSTWGSESAVLMNIADGLVLMGGGAGTLTELANALKINEGRLRAPPLTKGYAPIMIAPVSGYGGVADLLPALLANSIIKQSLWETCFPPATLHNGAEAATYLLHALNIIASPI